MPDASKFLAWWRLDEASGNRIDEMHGYVMTDKNSVLSATGHVEALAADFDSGNNELLYLNDDTWMHPSNNEITMGAIIKTETDHDGFVAGKYSKYQSDTFYMYVTNTKKIAVGVNAGKATSAVDVISAGNTFILIAWADPTGTDTIYIEAYNTSGTLAGSVNASITIDLSAGSQPFGIGAEEPNGTYEGSDYGYFNGLIEQVWVYGGVMSQAERLAMVNGGAGRDYGYILGGGSPLMF